MAADAGGALGALNAEFAELRRAAADPAAAAAAGAALQRAADAKLRALTRADAAERVAAARTLRAATRRTLNCATRAVIAARAARDDAIVASAAADAHVGALASEEATQLALAARKVALEAELERVAPQVRSSFFWLLIILLFAFYSFVCSTYSLFVCSSLERLRVAPQYAAKLGASRTQRAADEARALAQIEEALAAGRVAAEAAKRGAHETGVCDAPETLDPSTTLPPRVWNTPAFFPAAG
jgi:hypothetical protein